MKYNTLTKTIGEKTFIFVTRGRAKPFTDDEVTDFLNQRIDNFVNYPVDIDEKEIKPFIVRDELRLMFLKDMRQYGVKHCINKYGGTSEQIIAEAARVAPYMNQEFKE